MLVTTVQAVCIYGDVTGNNAAQHLAGLLCVAFVKCVPIVPRFVLLGVLSARAHHTAHTQLEAKSMTQSVALSQRASAAHAPTVLQQP